MVGVAPLGVALAVGGVTVESAHAAGASSGNFLCPELVNGVTGSLDDRVEFGGLVRRLRGLFAAGVKGLGLAAAAPTALFCLFLGAVDRNRAAAPWKAACDLTVFTTQLSQSLASVRLLLCSNCSFSSIENVSNHSSVLHLYTCVCFILFSLCYI